MIHQLLHPVVHKITQNKALHKPETVIRVEARRSKATALPSIRRGINLDTNRLLDFVTLNLKLPLITDGEPRVTPQLVHLQ